MSLLWMDGFDGQEGVLNFDGTGSAFGSSTVTPYGYGRSMTLSGVGALAHKIITPSTDVYIGYQFKQDTFGTGYCDFYSSTVQHIRVTTNATGGISILRGVTAVAASANNIVSTNAWNYVEIHARVDDTTGIVEVWLNGGASPVVSFSGDTKNAGTTTDIDAIRFTCASNSVTCYYDDLWCTSGVGSANVGRLGEQRVYFLTPSGAGALTGLTPSTGSNWQNVDDQPPVATDYNGSPTVGAADTYAITDLPVTPSAIKGVKVSSYMLKSDAGASSMKPILRIGSTNYYGATRTLLASLTGYFDLWDVSPATSAAFTTSEVNAAQTGAEVA